MVMYCGPDCQSADWGRHKIECSHLKSLGLWGLVFDPAEELARYPLLTERRTDETEDPPIGPNDVCGICGVQENLVRTECCGMILCDKEEEYEMFSYSRQFCVRSHRRYTTCGSHYGEGHESPDWRTCEECNSYFVVHIDEAGRKERI